MSRGRTTLIADRRNKGLEPSGVTGEIAAQIEKRLTLGYYTAGQMLSVNLIAEEFGVSRQPVTTALMHLRAGGYVEIIPQVGCRVVTPTAEEVKDFFLMSSKIESIVVSLAAERYRGVEADTLLSISAPKDLSSLETNDQRSAYVEYVDRFHDQLWEMAHAPLLERRIAGIRRLSNFYLWQGILTIVPSATKHLSQERSEIARAVAARDIKLASRLMEQHILHKPQLVGLVGN